ncbi:hypothetical protein GCM10010174_84590 [Kutzneria viridogrisea]|uniref:Phosphatidylinositol phosphate synthase n=2 Tax=Kutzneria TaxID=43356 RepID=W5W4K3_9PSEU|nr:CDP-alcohol phosphatidyltransferase [Kutzneria albida DSM 43870]MBA8926663.1 CDP-diacylglycerol--glycerol-3-phosphate 3-phosphatidyltransferase [Kutzneria viridogrisea]
MLNIFARASVSRVTDPVGAWLLRLGVTPNVVTVIGTLGTVAASLWFFPRDDLFLGTVVVTVFAVFDLVDGAVARARGATPFGAVLDASCDRIADGALLGAIAWWCLVVAQDRLAGAAALISLVCAQVISYVKARAEATGLDADGGLVERAERLILALVGTGLQGLGVPLAVDVSMCALAVLAVITVAQRLSAVHRSARDRGAGGHGAVQREAGDGGAAPREAGQREAEEWDAGLRVAGDGEARERGAGKREAGDCQAGDREAGLCGAGDRGAGDREPGQGQAGECEQ